MSDTLLAGVEEALEQTVQKQTQLPWEIKGVQANCDKDGLILSWGFTMPIGPEDSEHPQSILAVSAQSDTSNGICKLYSIRLDSNGMEALSILKMFHE